MKKFLVLLVVLALFATSAMAATTQLEKGPAHHKQTIKRHAGTKHQKKQLAKREQKKAGKKVAKRSTRKHKVAV